jgi:hypothetical protein
MIALPELPLGEQFNFLGRARVALYFEQKNDFWFSLIPHNSTPYGILLFQQFPRRGSMEPRGLIKAPGDWGARHESALLLGNLV